MQITEDRRKRVIELYFNQGKSYSEIAQIEKMSPRDISAIIKEEEARRLQHKHQQHQEELSSKAYKLFSEKKSPVEVAIILNLREPEATKLFIEYCKLKRLHKFYLAYKELGDNGIGYFVKLCKIAKKEGWVIERVFSAVDIAADKLPYIEGLYKQVKDEVENLQHIRQGLINDIEALKYKISLLDKTAFSSEQDCKRTEQRVHELTARNNRIEKMIANILNGEGYTKIKQITKENVKVVLSENRKLISISFVALIQTLKDDPQMVNLIQNMPSANDGEQYKDNNITKYLEANKDTLLDLSENNYENLVEELTNNAINTVADYSLSNSTLSLPQSSSPTFPDLSTQSYIFRIEESDTHHNSTGDIAE